MKFTKASDRPTPTLPLTSLIDIIFQLLIFFLITSSLTATESELASALQVERQAAGGSAADFQPQVVHVELRDGRTTFRLGERAVYSAADLVPSLRELPKAGGVFVRVTDAVNVEAAAAALQACKDAGFTKVSYVPAR